MVEVGLIGITGGHGYVGTLVQRQLAEAGHQTVLLTRSRKVALEEEGRRRFDLSQPIPEESLVGLDGIVHCAWDMRTSRKSDLWTTNVEGTNRLLDLAFRLQIRRVIFVSTIAAFEGTKQWYGFTKFVCERTVLRNGHAVIRPGLVYGPGWGGMVGKLRALCRLPVVPLLAPRRPQFTVHEEDLARAVVTLVEADDVPSAPLGVAHPEPVAFEDVVRAIAASQGLRPRYLSVPWVPVLAGLRAAEAVGVSVPFKADSLLGLVHPPSEVPNADLVEELGISVRPFETNCGQNAM